MNDPAPVDIRHGLDQSGKELMNLGQRQRTSVQASRKCASCYVGRDEKKPSLVLTELIQRQNMLMFDVGVHFSFAEETFACNAIMHKVETNNLDGYFTVKDAALACKIDFPHSTNIDTTDQVIVTKTELILPLVDRTPLFISGALLLSHWFVFECHLLTL